MSTITPIGTPAQWREIAEAFRCEPDKRDTRQFSIASSGLCWAIIVAESRMRVTSAEYATLQEFMLQFHPENAHGPFWYRRDRQGDLLRAAKAEEIAAWIEKHGEGEK